MTRPHLRTNRHLSAKTRALPQGGFTIVELLAAIAISVPLILILYQMGVTSAQALTTVYGLGQAELELNAATDSFMRDVRQATAIDTTLPGGEFTQDLTSEGESPNGRATLLLRTPAIVGGQPSSTKFDYVIYDFTEQPPRPKQLTRFVRTDPSSSRQAGTRVVANNVLKVTFNDNNPSYTLGEVKLRITALVPKDRYSFQEEIVNSSAAWRN